MADNHSKEIRSMNMSHIRSKDNKPEEIVRKFLFSLSSRVFATVKMFAACPAAQILFFPSTVL